MADTHESVTGFVTICGAPIYYETAGAGPALVLIHEGIADSRMYDDQFPVLAEHHRAVRYDLPGFGRSAWPTEPYAQHQVLHDLLRHLDIEHAALLGMSLGGIIAIDFALVYPEMVEALLLLASGIGGYPLGEATRALAAPIGAAFQAGDFIEAIELTVRMWVDGQYRSPEQVNPVVRERVRVMFTDVLRRTREGVKRAAALDPPACDRLEQLRMPALVVAGTGDVPDILAQADLLGRTLPNARKVLVPELAHLLNMEDPARINRLILDFLAAL